METFITFAMLGLLAFGVKSVWLTKEVKDEPIPMDLDFHKRFQNRFLG